jgi:anti-anti-sigma factor
MHDEPLALRVHRVAGTFTLILVGELDMASAGILAEAVDSLSGEAPDTITIDTEALTFIDSSGLGALLATRQTAPVQLAHTPSHLRRLLEMTSTSALFGA